MNAFLVEERVCRLATVGATGAPNVTPLWFVWDGRSLWLNSTFRSQRWRDLERDRRVSVVVDAGEEFTELRGVELSGEVVVASEVPRTTQPRPELADVERQYAWKYAGVPDFVPDGRHAWLRLTPTRLVSWDFRKSEGLSPRRVLGSEPGRSLT
ncbi:pyridoxamine 5'-phosphate oxidase family protein [Nocardioides panacihumi]|uniref:Pyridoxamine 5'-phosphate oxidase family protein n=1 Tax=Nocardioides panacihumi TaxID=400774 RepID=A0ABN2QA05_9ACTN